MRELTPSEIERTIALAAVEDEAALIAAARMDRQAFAPLYERYVTPIYRYCYHRLGHREAAEDATSLVFTKALAALPRYRPTGSFRSWLFAIAHNTVIDLARGSTPTALFADDEVVTAERSPEAAVIAGQDRDEVYRLLITLPDDQRRVMELRLSGLSSPEVAVILGRSAVAVRSLQFRAVARLRAHLTPDFTTKEGASDAQR